VASGFSRKALTVAAMNRPTCLDEQNTGLAE
jgi:hypothetical protein